MAKPTHFLREWRLKRGLTLEQVAEHADTTHATLSRIERGKLPYSQPLLERLAMLYAVDIASLLGRDPERPEVELWTIFADMQPVQQAQVIEIAKTLKRSAS